MPEMHSLTPLLGMLQNQGRHVALVTDGRLSGASGKVLSAIHVTPEAARGGRSRACARATCCASTAKPGTLEALVDAGRFAAPHPIATARRRRRTWAATCSPAIARSARPPTRARCRFPAVPLLPERHGEQDEDAEYALGADADAAAAPHEAKDA
jgi:phosphogluconate dehydratase